MKEIKDDLLKRLCEDDSLPQKSFRKSQTSFKPPVRALPIQISQSQNPLYVQTTKPQSTQIQTEKHSNLQTYPLKNKNEQNSRIFEDSLSKKLKIGSPSSQPRLVVPQPLSMQSITDPQDLHENCVSREKYIELKNQVKEILKEHQKMEEENEFLQNHIKFFKKILSQIHHRLFHKNCHTARRCSQKRTKRRLGKFLVRYK